MSVQKRDLNAELLEAIEEVKAYKRGEIELRTTTFAEVAAPQEIRRRLNLSQSAFAGMMGVSVRTIQDWEQGRHHPSGPAQALLRIADQQPEVFLKLRLSPNALIVPVDIPTLLHPYG